MTNLSATFVRKPCDRADHVFSLVLAMLIAPACATEPTPPDIGPPGLTVLSGAGQSDTIEVVLPLPLIVQVRDSSGRPASGATVRFQGHLALGSYRTDVGESLFAGPVYDVVADVRGRAQAFVRLGPVAGPTFVRVSRLPLLGTTDSARAPFSVNPGRAAQVILPIQDSTAYAGNGYALNAAVGDRRANRRSEPLTYQALQPSIATVDPNGDVLAVQLGRAAFEVTGAGFADTAWITVPPQGVLAAIDVLGNSATGIAPGLVVVHLDGSRYRRIAEPGSHPEWIATGDSVMYERGGRLHLLDTLGTMDRVLLASGPTSGETRASTSAGGEWLFFNDAAGCGPLYRARPDGTQAVWIGPTACDSMVTWASASPDGARAAVWRAGGITIGGIGILDVDNGSMNFIVLNCPCPSTNYPARWSPDGASLAFVRDTVIFLTTPSGSTPVALTSPDTASYEPVEFDWSPDSQWLVARRRNGLDVVRVSDGLRLPLGWSFRFREPAWRP